MSFIDVHAHLEMLEDPPEIALQKAKAAGVTKVVTIGTEPADHPIVLELARKYYPDVYCTLGIHPHHGAEWTEEAGQFIRANLSDKTVIAIGEIGLDYFYKNSAPEAQKMTFRK